MKTKLVIVTTLLAGSLAFAEEQAPADASQEQAPEVSQPDQPESSQPEASQPEATQPEPSQAENGQASESEAAPVEVAQAETPAAAAAAPETAAESEESKPSGEAPTSIEYVGAEIADVLRTLARQAGLNIVLAEDVQGKVTISLTDVPYEKAMKLIAESKGFVLTKEDNVLKVQSKAAVAAEPLQEEIITLEYTTAADAEKVVKPFLTQGRGSVTIDTRSNTLVVSDVPARLEQIKEIVRRIDQQTPQVMIEARVIETAKNPRQDYGIRWDSLRNYEIAAKNMGYKFDPTRGAFGRYPGGDKEVPIRDAEVAVLTASDFRLLISFLNSNGETELLASPRIVTTDNKEAKINIAQQFPIPSFTFNQQTASLEVSGFTFKDIGILLGVTPHINKNGFVTLELKPEVSSFDPTKVQTFGGAVQAQVPIIDTRNLQASVLIKDGHTLAIGGLIREDITRSFTKVPLMGDIPGLGAAFRSKSFDKSKRNLLIFITPTVVGPEGSTGFEDQYTGVKGTADDDYANPKGWRDNAFPVREQGKRARAVAASK